MRRMGLGRVCAAAAVLVAVAVGAGCSGDDGGGDAGGGGTATGGDDGGSSTEGAGGPTAAELCEGAELAEAPPAVAQPDLAEASGVAASRRFPGVLWAHNDSGGAAEVFAIGPDGADRGRFPLGGAEAVDWEDMALASAPDAPADVLYLGDIGDNGAGREHVVVYRVPEPTPAAAPVPAGSPPNPTQGGVEALTLTYADGARDAETLLADPRTGDLFVLDKDLLGGPVGAYRVPAGTAPGAPVAMERVAEVGLPPGQIATGGDVSADGSVVAVRTYTGLYLWDRGADQTVPEALAGEPCSAPVAAESQGEAVALAPDGRGYTTLGEGQNRRLNTASWRR